MVTIGGIADSVEIGIAFYTEVFIADDPIGQGQARIAQPVDRWKRTDADHYQVGGQLCSVCHGHGVDARVTDESVNLMTG